MSNDKNCTGRHSVMKIGMFDKYSTLLLPIILAIADYCTIALAVLLAYTLRKNGIPMSVHPQFAIKDIYIFFVVPVFFILVLFLCNSNFAGKNPLHPLKVQAL